jgi:APA family basic amino acid/polyamine antiporter
VARRLTAPARFLRARSLALVAYGEIGSSLVFALGIVALYALGLTPWVLLAVGALILVVTLSYAEGAAAMPEPGGAATFVRRAFSDPAGFVTGWVLFLDYLVVISLAALFVPHYVGEALGWESVADGPWDAIVAIAVVCALAGLRRVLRGGRLLRAAVVSAAIALFGQLLLAGLGFALVLSSDSLSVGVDLGTAPSWGSIALALSLATLAYTGLETVTNFAAEAREPGRTLPRSLFVGIGAVVLVNLLVAVVGVSAFPAGPDPRGPDGVASGLGVDWLQAPLVGIATVIGDDLPDGWAGALEGFIGLSGALVLVTAIVTSLAGAERLAFSMARYDMLPHVFARPERGAAPTATATLAATLIASVLLVISDVVGDGAEFLASLYSFGVLIALTAAQVAVVRLRVREPELERPFRVPGGVRVGRAVVPLPSVVGAVLTGGLWVAALFTHDAARVVGPIWLALGVVVYLLSRRAAGESLLGRATPAVPDLVPGPEVDAQRILVPLKLSEIGQEVLATALRLAEERGAQVHVLHVLRVPMSEPLDAPDPQAEAAGAEAVAEAREIAQELGVELTARVVRARSLAQAVLDEAEAVGADLILMGSAPRWRRQSRFFSPTVDEVLRRASTEVMVVTYPEGVLAEEEGG